MFGNGSWMMGGMMGGWGMLTMLLFWIGLILLIVWLVRAVTAAGSQNAPTARELLDQRYARGEVTRKEYEQIKKDLGN